MSSGFGGTGAGQIRYTISIDDSQAVQKLQGFSQQMTTVGNSTQQATQQVQQMPAAIDEVKRSSDEASKSQQSFGSNLRSAAFGITAAAGGIVSLVQQYTSLKRAQNTLERSQNTEIALRGKITDLVKKEKEAIKEHGKNSDEARKATRLREDAERKLGTLTEKNSIMQESMNNRLADFATSIVPQTIGVVAGLAQTFDILGRGRTGIGGMMGTLGMIGKFIGPLAVLGIAVFAIKTNFLGFRDILDGVGKAIGDALPGLKPFLDAIRNIGIVLGLVPGDADKAQQSLKELGGSIIQTGKEIGATFGEIFNALKTGDINKAISTVKSSIVKGFKSLGVDIQAEVDKFKKDPIKYVTDALVEVDKFLGIKGKDGKEYSFTAAIQEGFKKRFEESKGNVLTLLANFNDFFNVEIGAIDPMTNVKIGGFTGEQWVHGTAAKIRVGAVQRWEEAKHDPIKLFADFNDFFNVEIGQFDPFADQTEQISKDIGASFDQHILTPLMTHFNSVKTAFEQFINENPIMQNIMAGDVLGAIKNFANQVKSWMDSNIVAPIISAWDKIVTAVKSYITSNPIFKFFEDLFKKGGEALGKLIPTAAGSFGDFGVFSKEIPANAIGQNEMGQWVDKQGNPVKNQKGASGSGTDMLNYPMSTGGGQANSLDVMARQIQQITKNLNTFAQAIVQVTKNISQWARATMTQTKDNDQLARTLTQITKNNNTFARTITTVTKDLNQQARATVQNTKNNNTFAKTIVETTKDFNTMARSINQNTKNLNVFARAVNQTTSNVKDLTKALNGIPSTVKVGIKVGLSGAGSPFIEQLL